MTTSAKPRRGGLFYKLVRARVATALARDHGYDRADARDLAGGLDDADLDGLADARGLDAVGDGGILSWFAAHADQIAALVEFVVSLFAGKGADAPA